MIPIKTNIRAVEPDDVTVLKEWLSNPRDCRMAIGHFPFTDEDFTAWSNAQDQFGWVLEMDSEPVGYGEVWIDDDSKDVELAHIIINPKFRGKGFGRTFTALLYQKACTFAYPWVYMRVYPENQQAITCYQSIGFTRFDDAPLGMDATWVWLRRACE